MANDEIDAIEKRALECTQGSDYACDTLEMVAAARALHAQSRADRATIETLRGLLRKLVGHLEARDGDGIREEAYDDYHAARMLVGQADRDWDPDAAGRGLARATS